jgi:hypothetical protein
MRQRSGECEYVICDRTTLKDTNYSNTANLSALRVSYNKRIPPAVGSVRIALGQAAVADHVVSQLKQHGDPWKLLEEAKPTRGPTT